MSVGYNDTPMLPDSEWHVHDGDRPQPTIVTPGTADTQESPGEAPSDATVLFDVSDTSKWIGRDGDVEWEVKDGYMAVIFVGATLVGCTHTKWAGQVTVKCSV